MSRIARNTVAVLSWAVLTYWTLHDPALFVCLGAVLILAGPVVRSAIRPLDRTTINLPAGPSRFSTLTAMGCLTVVKAAIAEGKLPRRNDHLLDRS